MTMVISIWCRHDTDNIIGIDKKIPWHKPHDIKNFLDIVENQNVVCGKITYESFDTKTLGDKTKIFVFTTNNNYEVQNKKLHKVVTSLKDFETLDEEEDLYIAGGKQIYELFFRKKEKFKPHIIVDCVYKGKIDNLSGNKIEISSIINEMPQKYIKLTNDYIKDEVYSSIWIKKGEFIEQNTLKRIVSILEKNT